MKVNVKTIAPCEKRLTIDVDRDLVSQEFATFYDSVGKFARIPGFRPGNAPRRVVALHYKTEARSEVLKHLLKRSLQEALVREKISVVGFPHVDDVDFDETHLKFNAHIETRPKIKLGKYEGIVMKREPLLVSEAEVERALKRLREFHAKFKAVENRPAALGDYLICDYRLEVDGAEIEKREGAWVQLDENDSLEGFPKQLAGAGPGDLKQVEIKFQPGYVRENLRGKIGHFSVHVQEIKEKELPVLNDEFAKEAGDFSTLEDLKKNLQKRIEAEKMSERERREENMIFEELLKKNRFDVPNGMIERRLKALEEEERRHLLQSGCRAEELEKEKEKRNQALRPQAERDVRISFLLSEIAEKENIRVTGEDIQREYEALSARFGRPPAEIKSYYDEDPERKDVLAFRLKQEETIRWLKDHATIKEGEKK